MTLRNLGKRPCPSYTTQSLGDPQNAYSSSLASAPTPRPTLFIGLPVVQYSSDPGAVRQAVDLLEVLLADFEGFGGDIGDVLANKLAWVNACLLNLFKQEAAEGLDARAQEGGVEGHIDALKRDGGNAAVQADRVFLGFRLFCASTNDVDELLAHFFERHALQHPFDIDFLGLEEIGDVG